MIITSKLRERKDHFVITWYKEDREKSGVSIGDIIILKLGERELVRPVRKDFHISLPKKELRNKNKGDKIKLPVLKIVKKSEGIKRPVIIFKEDKIDIRFFIPKKTLFNHVIYVLERDVNYSTIWYPVGGGVRHINIKNFINADKLAELMGFYFGDGTTCKTIRSLRLTNSEPSALDYCLEIFEAMGIERHNFKVQVIYCTDKEITCEIKSRCVEFWSSALRINKENIVSVTKSNNKKETLAHGSARIFLDNTVLVEILLHGLLKGILQRISNPEKDIDKRLLNGFMRGLLAAEGSVILNKNGSVVKIGIAHDPHSDELELYRKWLANLGIRPGANKGNELYVYGFDNIRKFYEIDAFKMHNKRNAIFVKGFLNNKKFKAKSSG